MRPHAGTHLPVIEDNEVSGFDPDQCPPKDALGAKIKLQGGLLLRNGDEMSAVKTRWKRVR